MYLFKRFWLACRQAWPYLILLLLVVLIGFLNYQPGTILTGGDNLHPEYNFLLNIRRSLFAVWQEYQGVGLLGGMGHSSDLLRQLLLWGASSFIPITLLRYFWTFFTLFIGACGAYKLISYLMNRDAEGRNHNEAQSHKAHLSASTLFPFLGAFFYLFNLSTVQSYYTPFEVFTAHFAALPWLLWIFLCFLHKPSAKVILLFLSIVVLSTPAAYVPTLFVVFLMAIGLLLLTEVGIAYATKRKLLSASPLSLPPRVFLTRGIKMFLIIFLLNLFWMLPFAFFTITKSGVNVNAKINQMATETIFLLNKESGGLRDAMLLKGFWFNNVEPNFQGINTYMLQNWRDHIANPLIQFIGFLLFGVIAIGVISSLRKRSASLPFVVVFLFGFSMLVTATPPFSWINSLTREVFPLFSQVFRFPFTKFSILTSLTYAIFFALGTQTLISWYLSYLSHKPHSRLALSARRRASPLILCALPIALCALFVFPIFQGHLLYDKERLVLPSAYTKLFSYLNEPDHRGRIANFPVETFWDWKFYSFGYSGSGFLWYGIENPILDRAFDMFSRENENYYHEMSQAVYAKDPASLRRVLQKYQIRWILFDQSLTYPQSPKSLFYPENEALFSEIPEIKKAESFGDITLYEVSLADHPASYVFATTPLPSVNAYSWIDNDTAYETLGNYRVSSQPEQYFPYRSLSSLKTQPELEYSLVEDGQTMTLTSSSPLPPTMHSLHIPSFLSTEQSIPGRFVVKKTGSGLTISMILQIPEVWIDQTKVSGDTKEIPLITLPRGQKEALNLNVNGIANYQVPLTGGPMGSVLLPLTQDSIFTLSGPSIKPLTTILSQTFYQSLPQLQEKTYPVTQGTTIQVVIPKVDHPAYSFNPALSSSTAVRNCDRFRDGTVGAPIEGSTLYLRATNATACIAYYTAALTHAEGYAIFVTAENTKGRSLHTWILNEDEKYSPLETYLPEDEKVTATFILPPQEQFGKAYSLHFDSQSIGHTPSENSISKVSVYPFPSRYITHLSFLAANQPQKASSLPPLAVTHTNESSYIVTNLPKKKAVLVLSQGYNAGWHAYLSDGKCQMSNVKCFFNDTFPFFFGKSLKHIEVNNWENGWELPGVTDDSSRIVIFFVPQLLEFIGFGVLGLTILVCLFVAKKRHK